MSDADERGCAVCGEPVTTPRAETCDDCRRLIASGARWNAEAP